MLYTFATIAGKEYKLRLGAQESVDVEKRLGKSVLDVLLHMAPDALDSDNPSKVNIAAMSMASVGDLCVILHGAMQKYQHGITQQQVFGLYDDHIDQGGSYEDFIGILKDVLQVSGFLPQGAAPTSTPEQPADDVPEA